MPKKDPNRVKIAKPPSEKLRNLLFAVDTLIERLDVPDSVKEHMFGKVSSLRKILRDSTDRSLANQKPLFPEFYELEDGATEVRTPHKETEIPDNGSGRRWGRLGEDHEGQTGIGNNEEPTDDIVF